MLPPDGQGGIQDTGSGGEPHEILVRVGKEDLRVDVDACAPQAAAFAAVWRSRQRGGPPVTLGCGIVDPSQESSDLVPGDLVSGAGDAAPAATSDGPADTETPGPCRADLIFPEFPGGMPLLKNVVKYLAASAAEERAAAAAAGALGVPAGVLQVNPGAFYLEYDTTNIGQYLEAAALLRCPRLLRDTVLAAAAKELSSRRVLSLLEKVILCTVEADPDNETIPSSACGSLQPPEEPNSPIQKEHLGFDREEDYLQTPVMGAGADSGEETSGREQVMQAFCQVIQRLCARLDAVDFKLTATLARGTPWSSLEVLRAYQVKVENLGHVNYALQSVTSTVKSFFYEDEKAVQQQKQEWKEHHFALHVFRKHVIEATLFSKDAAVRKASETAMSEEQEVAMVWSDDEKDAAIPKTHFADHTENDIPEAICDGVSDATLAGLAGFVLYCDPVYTPPVLAAAMVRSLLLVKQSTRARALFEAVFVRSRKVQAMITSGNIPVEFLGSVKKHRMASLVLRRLLARYESLNRPDLCSLLDHVLLQDFADEKHCVDLVLKNELVQDIVVYCRVSTRAVAGAAEKERGPAEAAPANSLLAGTSGEVELLRLRRVGEKLFAAGFVMHNGFLPLAEDHEPKGENWPAGPLGIAECPWDSGDLDLPLLQHVPDSEDVLHLSRRVLLRGLFRRQHANVENDVPTTVRFWALGKWPSCRDAVLISEAFSFVSLCWKALRSAKAKTKWSDGPCANWRADEDSLFKMFSDLEYWRLQPRELLTPWVPPQLLACHVSARCRLLDEQQRTLMEDNRSNLQEINRLRQTISELFTKLEVVDKRSVQSMQKQAEVVETLRTIR